MARVTVEDCLEHVDNRFELVQLATKRARQIAYGSPPLVDWENDKPTVVALREIAAGLIDKSILEENVPASTEEEVVGGVEISQEDMESVPGIEAVAQPTAAPAASTEEVSASADPVAAALEAGTEVPVNADSTAAPESSTAEASASTDSVAAAPSDEEPGV